ncbi:hypothetical protein HS962_02195 [Pantoea sp. BIGb0393]|uniref:MarR family transcriptional regulator n=1 Tax=Pantoea nemavictus TaxID=2726955 RepID=A0ABU8PPV3_9GAMM|nr:MULTISPECIES: hypothetical protein [Pantoea]KNC08246.1 hypothetical protein AC790_16785 [Pantoea sp. RIT-PI-b]MBA0035054.1 hypothetical protein [Pantoea nemavictus]
MKSKQQLTQLIFQRAQEIKSHKNIALVMQKHYKLLFRLYLTKPLYFKAIFKANRFIIGSAIMAYFFTTHKPTLCQVKDFCKKTGLISNNTIDSFLLFIRVSGRMEVEKDAQDKRKLTYKVTTKALDETRALINTMMIPYGMLYEDFDVSACLKMKTFKTEYFKKYADITLNHVYLFDMVPESKAFIFRDAGHMLLMDLYIETLKQQSSVIEYNYLKASLKCGVSRSHIKRCLQAAEAVGLLTLDAANNSIILHLSFMQMALDYFAVYMAMVEYGLRGLSGVPPLAAR